MTENEMYLCERLKEVNFQLKNLTQNFEERLQRLEHHSSLSEKFLCDEIVTLQNKFVLLESLVEFNERNFQSEISYLEEKIKGDS